MKGILFVTEPGEVISAIEVNASAMLLLVYGKMLQFL